MGHRGPHVPSPPYSTVHGQGEWPGQAGTASDEGPTLLRAQRLLGGHGRLWGPHEEATPLTLDGRLAGLAQELVDGGQGLWFALQGRMGHVATVHAQRHEGRCLPHAPQEVPGPQTGAYSPSLLAPLWVLAAPGVEGKGKSRSGQRSKPTAEETCLDPILAPLWAE